MTLEEREQLKEEIVDKMLEANKVATANFIVTILDEIKTDVINRAMEMKL